jgi:GDP-4-dehydro-6-deoxy-D-mannose reductase
MPISTDWAAPESLADMKVLVTGADGFVGRYLVERLAERGHEVTAACRPGVEAERLVVRWRQVARMVPLELTEAASVKAAVDEVPDAVVHLAAVASVREAREDPGRAWVVNAAGTARLLEAILSTRQAGGDPLVLVVSSAEVYGSGPARPRGESDAPAPQSPYAASKLGGEVAALEVWRRSGLRVVIARPFTHTGPGQGPPYVVPSFLKRLLEARAAGATRVPTGNLDPIRDMLDVRDVVDAYLALLTGGKAGETYNIGRGEGITLRELFRRAAAVVGVEAEPVPDLTLQRSGDIPYLVADTSKLRRAVSWAPTISLEQTLREMVDAQTH